MNIGIVSTAFFRLPDPGQNLTPIEPHGFSCIDLNLLNTEHPLYALDDAGFEACLRRVGEQVREQGLEVYQTHGPWRFPPQDTTKEDREERFEKMSRALWGTRLVGSRHCVIHPLMPFGVDEQPDPDTLLQINLDFFTRLCRVAEQHRVIICLENMPFTRFPLSRVPEILSFVRKVDSPWLRVCLDTGHCAVCGESPADGVRLLGKEYLRALHVHDNDGLHDLHAFPGEAIIDWPEFSRALHEIGFEGAFSLETKPDSALPAAEYEQKMLRLAQIARELA